MFKAFTATLQPVYKQNTYPEVLLKFQTNVSFNFMIFNILFYFITRKDTLMNFTKGHITLHFDNQVGCNSSSSIEIHISSDW